MTVSPETIVSEVRDYIYRYNYTGFPVLDKGCLVGMVTFDDIRKIPLDEQETMALKDLAIRPTIIINPHQSARSAMDLMYENNIGRLAVVEKGSRQKLMGIVTRTDVIHAYEREIKKSHKEQRGMQE